MVWNQLGISVCQVLPGMLHYKLQRFNSNLLSDPDIVLMFESGIRRGIATISHRHAKANNEYMEAQFDPVKESNVIAYSDANNLYGWANQRNVQRLGLSG